VKEIGSDITRVQPGDKVLLSFNPCMECANCRLKLPGYCDHFESRLWSGLRQDSSFTLKSPSGTSIYGNFFGQSAFSRLVLVNGSCMVKVAPETDLRLFAPLGCGVQTGTGVVWNTLDVQRGESLIISGCGAVGMSAIMAARERCASTIIAVDVKPERLDLARELGATHALNGLDIDLAQQVRAICSLPKGVRHGFDTTAVPGVIEMLIEAVGVRGQIVVVGATPLDKKISIQPLQFLNMGKKFIGSVEGESYPPEVRLRIGPTEPTSSIP
jgi:Zn-dependent alcohol dehydrogenase